jgi:Protein of unknown function (DUF1559)
MILPFMEQGPLYNSMNFNLSIAYAANDTCSLTALSVYLCPSDDGSSVVPVFDDLTDPANPGSYSGTHIVDTLSRGNYVGMWGSGENRPRVQPGGFNEACLLYDWVFIKGDCNMNRREIIGVV